MNEQSRPQPVAMDVTASTTATAASGETDASVVAWLKPATLDGLEPADVITDVRKREWATSHGTGGRMKAAQYTEPLYGQTLFAALEKIWLSGHPNADEHMPELRGISEAEFGDRLVRIAGQALGRLPA